MSAYWGEYSDQIESSEGLLSSQDFLLSSYDSKPEPSFISPPVINIKEDTQLSSEQTSVKGGIVDHTIELERYRSQLHSLIDAAVQQLSEHIVGEANVELKECPSPPPCVNCHSRQNSSADDTDIHDRDFVRGIGLAPPIIKPSTCNQLLRRAMAQIALHQGYEEAAPSALDALAGACQIFYNKLLTQLRHNVDMEAECGYTGFQDSMHRTLAQVGHVDLRHLLLDYRSSTVDRHDKLLLKCTELHAAYVKITLTKELPEHLLDALASINREATPSIFSLSDTEERSEGSNAVEVLDGLGEDDDAQKLLELAGMSGFDITIEPETLEEAEDAVSEALAPEPPKPMSKGLKSKSKGKGSASSAAKRRKKH